MTVIGISSDAPLMVGAASAVLSGSGYVMAVGPVFHAPVLQDDHPVWSTDVVVVDVAGQQRFVDIEASAVPGIAKRVPVVLLLTEALGHRLGDLLRLGLRGVLPRTCAVDELADAVEHVKRGALYVAPEFAAQLAEQFVPDRLGTALTPREGDVLDLLSQSLTYAEIASRLLLSRHTVKFHVSNVLAKLGVTTRREAAARWATRPFSPVKLPVRGGSIPSAVPDPLAAPDSYGETDRGDPARSGEWRTA